MFNDGHEQQAECPSQGLLRPGRFLWARAVPWGIVFGIVLWIAYKFVKGVGIASGLDGSSGVPTVLGVLAALALYVLSVRLIERRTPDELGLAQLAPELAAGIVLGVALYSGIMVVLIATGAYAMTGPTAAAPWQALIGSLGGTVEELIFRGAIFRLLWSSLGVWWALGLSSALFGAAHLIKPSADLMAVLGIIFAGGIPMAALYLLTSRLWASIGYHIAWNFTEAYVFGAQVSGTRSGPSLYHVRPAAGVDTLWSGGAFGPEASVANVVMGLLVGAACLHSRSVALDQLRRHTGARSNPLWHKYEAPMHTIKRALSNRMTRSEQIASDGRWPASRPRDSRLRCSDPRPVSQ